MLKSLLLFALFCPPSTWAGYSLVDLEVLANEGSHQEFFKHALDVRPSERQETWKGMVTKMADAFGRQILSKSEITRENYQQIEALYQWPSLKSDDVFRARRRDIGLRYLKSCLKGPTPCWKEVKEFWEAENTDPDVAFKLAELTISSPDSPLRPWVFLDVALKSPLSEFYCKKDFVLETLWKKLEADYINLKSSEDFLAKIDGTVHPDCLGPLNQEAQKRLTHPLAKIDREIAYEILKAQGKANEALSDFFLSVYLLEGPSQGDLFNMAWNRLKDLSKAPLRREELLKRFKDLDPLPDDILTSFDETKKRVVLTHFKQNFPEYLDLYLDQCLNFYSGKIKFENGNPTIHCQDLIKAPFAPQILSTDKIKQYQDIRKI